MIRGSRTVLILMSVTTVLCALPGLAASDLTTGIALLKKGSYVEARAALERAYKRNPTGPQTKFWYARSLQDAAAAIKLYTELAADTKVADSLRIPSMVRLAGAATLKGDHVGAADWYAKAAKLKRDPQVQLHRAASLISAEKWDTADSVLSSVIAADSASPAAAHAWYYRGEMLSRRDSCAAAIAAFDRALLPGDTVAWRVAARSAALTCATKLGDTTSARRFRDDLDTISGSYLEASAVLAASSVRQKSSSSTVDRPTKPTPTAPATQQLPKQSATADSTPNLPAATTGAFTIQVGSFGTIVNAQKLQKRLIGEFKSVRVVPFSSKGTMFYRVRLGSFATREEADAFAQKSLKGKNLTFSVVAE